MFSITPAISRSNRSAVSAARAGHLLGGRLRRRDDHELRLRQQLGERHRDVAGAGRQVDQQVVELAPVHVLEELADRLVEHRPAPGDRLVALVQEELDRDGLHAGRAVEREDLALRRDLGPAVDAQHARDRVAPHVGVERRGQLALGLQRGGEVRGDRGLAHAALARADADHVLDGRQRALGEPAASGRAAAAASASPVGEHVEPDVHDRDAEAPGRFSTTAVSKWVRIGQPAVVSETITLTRPLVGLLDRADHPERDDVLAELGIDHAPERVLDLFTGGHPVPV